MQAGRMSCPRFARRPGRSTRTGRSVGRSAGSGCRRRPSPRKRCWMIWPCNSGWTVWRSGCATHCVRAPSRRVARSSRQARGWVPAWRPFGRPGRAPWKTPSRPTPRSQPTETSGGASGSEPCGTASGTRPCRTHPRSASVFSGTARSCCSVAPRRSGRVRTRSSARSPRTPWTCRCPASGWSPGTPIGHRTRARPPPRARRSSQAMPRSLRRKTCCA